MLIKDVPTVRRLLGNDKIVGVSVNTVAEAREAISEGADYLGSFSVIQLIVQVLALFSIHPLNSYPALLAASRGFERFSNSWHPRLHTSRQWL
jgi:purine-cytosine permease-like protein